MAALLLFVLPHVAAGEEEDQKNADQTETSLVRVNITVQSAGAKETVEIGGKQIADYRPTIIQVFPSTGVVFDDKGDVLTFLGYSWVDIQSRKPRVEIFTSDGQKYQGKLIGIDQSLGVAVVRALEARLKMTPLCQNCEIQDGATIMTPVVEGAAFQEFRTAQILSVGSLVNAAQRGSWDITVNQALPGVGEPVLNMNRQVLGFLAGQRPSPDDPMGVRTVVYPMSQLLNSAGKILKVAGDIQTGWLGAYIVPSPTGTGVMIKQIEEGSPAQKAGLASKDVLVKWNGREILDPRQFIQLVQNTSIGSRVNLQVERNDKTLRLATLIEARKPASGPGRFAFNFPGTISLAGTETAAGDQAGVLPRIGIETAHLSPQLADFLQMPGQSGLLVLKVENHLPAARAGVRVGDVITSVDGEPILDPQVFYSHIEASGWGGRLLLGLLRKGDLRKVTILLPKFPRSKEKH